MSHQGYGSLFISHL